jgi:hypothetical protein
MSGGRIERRIHDHVDVGTDPASTKITRDEDEMKSKLAAMLLRVAWLAPWWLVALASNPGSNTTFSLNKKARGEYLTFCFFLRAN